MTGPSQASEAIDGTNTRRSQFQWYFDVPSLWRPTLNNANQNKRTSADNGGPRTMSQSSMSSWLSVSYSLSPTARFIASYQFTTSDIRFLETIMLLNNIILPILAILFVSSDCFYNVLFQAPTVTSSYNYVTCPRYFFNGLVAAYCSTATETTTYSPPFFYRYQCSSEIVINYVPVYIWMFLFVGIVLPLTKVVLKLLYDYLTPMYRAAKKKEKIALAKSPPTTTLKSSKKEGTTEPAAKSTVKVPRSYSTRCLFHTYYLLEMILPDSLQKLTPKSPLESKTDPSNPTTVAILNDEQPPLELGRERASTLPAPPALAAPSAITAASGFLFKKLKLGVQINSYLTVMISFGVLFPPLAVIACVTVISVTYFEEHAIGRLLYLSKEYGYHWYEERLEQESDGAADSLVLSSQSMVTVACGLYAYIVFDTWGDQEGWYSALAPSLLMGCIPVIVYLVDYHLQRKKKLTLKARLQSIEELFHIQLSERSNLRITTTTNPSEYSPSEVSRNTQSRVKIPDVVIPDSEMELGEKKIEEPEENSKVTEQDEEEKEDGNGEEDSEDE